MPLDMTGFRTPYDPMAAFRSLTPGSNSPDSMGFGTSPLTDPGFSQVADPSVYSGSGAGNGNLFGWDSPFLSTSTQQGWGGTALGVGQGLFNAWMGLQQYGLAKDQLREGKRQFGLNYDAQVKTTNSALEDRQRARVASNPGAYQSVGDYMTQYGIKPAGG